MEAIKGIGLIIEYKNIITGSSVSGVSWAGGSVTGISWAGSSVTGDSGAGSGVGGGVFSDSSPVGWGVRTLLLALSQ